MLEFELVSFANLPTAYTIGLGTYIENAGIDLDKGRRRDTAISRLTKAIRFPTARVVRTAAMDDFRANVHSSPSPLPYRLGHILKGVGR